MSAYHVDLMRKVSKFYDPVRRFSFEARDDAEAIVLTKCMHIFPSVDDCDLAVLLRLDGKCLWADYRNA